MMPKKSIGIILLCVLLLWGCGGNVATRSFVRENTNLGLVKTVAVMPFEGGGRAPRIRELTMTQLLGTGAFDVVDKGRVDVFLQQEALPEGAALDGPTIRRLGESLDLQAVFLGSVEQSNGSRGSASFPEITMTLRLVDCKTGQLLWQASGRGSGYSVADRLFGFAPKDSFQVTMGLLDELIETMEVEQRQR